MPENQKNRGGKWTTAKHPDLFIFGVALTSVLIFALIFPTLAREGGDFLLYQRIADNILMQGDFGGEPQKTYGSPSINPGFAFFLTGFQFFFGKSVVALLGVAFVLHAFLAVGIYFLAKSFFDERRAVIAGAMASVWPMFLIQSLEYGSSLMLYSVVLTWGTFFFTDAVDRYLPSSLFGGVFLGFAVLIDSIAFFIPALLLVWVFVTRRSRRAFISVALFVVAFSVVISPWVHRNIKVADELGSRIGAPLISKDELQQVSPSRLVYMTSLVSKDGVLLSGLTKTFISPYNISILDSGTDVSYKQQAMLLVSGQPLNLSGKEVVILATKIVVTLTHWVLIMGFIIGLLWLGGERERAFFLLTALFVGYIVVAVIGFGALAQDNFQSISAPSSFLFPLVPLFIICVSSVLLRLKTQYIQR